MFGFVALLSRASAWATPPTITQQPGHCVAVSGQSATFTVAATGSGSLAYQWNHLGTPIPGATTSTLALTNVTMADAGFYDVIVTVGGEGTRSGPGMLEVRPARYPDGMVVDTTFAPRIEQSGHVTASAVAPDGGFFVCGRISSVNDLPRNRIARFNAAGVLDPAFVPVEIDNDVTALVAQPDGKVVIGGYFNRVGGVWRGGLARLNADGTLDSSFATGLSGSAYALALGADGKIVAGGWLYPSNGQRNCVRLNADGSVDATFETGAAFDASVMAVAVQPDGKVVVGGYFTNLGGTARNRIARLNANGTLDASFGLGTGFDGTVQALRLQPDGRLLAGGSFGTYNGTSCGRLARLNSDGTLDGTFAVGTGFGGWPVYSLGLQADGRVVVGGQLDSYQGTACRNVVRLHPNGSYDATFSTGTGFNGTVQSVAVRADGTVVAGGSFETANGLARTGLVLLGSDGAVVPEFAPAVRQNATVFAALPTRDGKWIIGGSFTHVDGVARGRLARLNADGSLDSSYNTGTGFRSYWGTGVYALAAQGDGKLVVGGNFYGFGPDNCTHLVRLNPDGSLDASFRGSNLLNGSVNDLGVQADGMIVIGGDFTSLGGASRNHLARLNTDGSLDPTFNVGTGFSAGSNWCSVLRLALTPDRQTVVTGEFTTYNGVARNRVARINGDGSLDAAFDAGTGPDQAVIGLSVTSEGKSYLGGDFSTVNGLSRPRVARLDAAGVVDTGFAVGTGFSSTVFGFLPQTDGKVLVGGWFGSYGGAAVRGLARLDSQGGLDTTFNPNVPQMTNLPLGSLLRFDDGGSLLVGGGRPAYVYMTGAPALQRYRPVFAAAIVTAPTTQTANPGEAVTFTVGATGTDLTYQWFKDGVAIAGATGPTLTLTNVQLADVANYTVTVANTIGAVTSSPVTIIGPHAAPTITQQPEVRTVRSGDTTTFSVGATGVGPLTYRWSHAGITIPGATGPTLTVANVTVANRGRYDVQVAAGLSVAQAQPGWLVFQTSPGLLWVSGNQVSNTQYLSEMVAMADGAEQVAAAGDGTFLLKPDGTLWATGSNMYGGLGDGTTADRHQLVQVASGVVAVAPGQFHTLYITTDGTLWGVGLADSGQLGPVATPRLSPVVLDHGVVAAAAGLYHSLWIRSDGTLWALGRNTEGQLGAGTATSVTVPFQVRSGVATVAAGGTSTYFVGTDGTLWAMGSNNSGQLGDGSTTNRSAPVPIVSGVRSVVAGNQHAAFVKNDGTLWTTGGNYYGQLGDGSTTNRSSPVQVATGVTSVAVGSATTLFLKADRTLWLTGAPCDGVTSAADAPHLPVELRKDVLGMAVGASHFLFRKVDGLIWGRGAIGRGQLGNGVTQPRVALEASDVVTASIGYSGVAYVRADGSLWSRIIGSVAPARVAEDVVATYWGVYTTRQEFLKRDLSLWSIDAQGITALVASDVVAAGVGLNFDVFLKRDGTLWGRGGDSMIQFGDGTVPVLIAADVAALSAGGWHTLYTRTDRSLWGIGTVWMGFTPDQAWGQWKDTSVRLEEGVGFAVADSNRNLYTKSGDALWMRGSGWAGPAATAQLVDTGVVAASAYGFDRVSGVDIPCLYLKSDETLWTSNGVKEADGVLAVLGSNEATGAFIQRAGAGQAPAIVSPPVAGSVVRGTRVTLEAVVSGSGPFDYRWAKDGTPLPWARGAQLVIAYAMPSDDGAYTVSVTNSAGTVSSAPAVLSVQAPPTIIAQSTVGLVGVGGTSKLTVSTFDGIPCGYRWQVSSDGGLNWTDLEDGALYAGSGTAGLSVRGITAATAGRIFRCRLSNSSGTITSDPIALRLLPGFGAVVPGNLFGTGTSYSLGNGTSYARWTPQPVAADVAQVVAGYNQTFILKKDGSLWASGVNWSGQLGDGTTLSRPLPVRVADNVGTVAVGFQHLVLLKRDGTAWAVGINSAGQLGDGTTVARLTPVLLASGVSQVACGFQHTAFLKQDGSLWTVGDNAAGQLGDGSTTNRSVPRQIADGVTQVAAGPFSTCWIDASGNLRGAGEWAMSSSGAVIDTDVRFIACGSWRHLYIKNDDTLWYRPGIGTNATSTMLATGVGSASVSGWGTAAGYLKKDLTFWAIGVAGAAQPPSGTVVQVANNVSQIASGDDHYLYTTFDGTLWSFGLLGSGELADGTSTSVSDTVLVAGGVGTAAAGPSFTLFVRASDGALFGTGLNANGQLGVGSKQFQPAPVQIATDVVATAAGQRHSLYLTREGRVFAMGANDLGQLGDGTMAEHDTPVAVADGVVAIAAGDLHSLLLKADGTLWGMGQNANGQLGLGSAPTAVAPQLIATDVVGFDTGGATSLFIRADGSLWAMGSNSFGNLGDGSTTTRKVPVRVVESGVVRAAASSTHSLFLRSDGSLWGMGNNASGQLAAGEPAQFTTPVPVTSGVVRFAASGSVTYYLDTAGVLWSRGYNADASGGASPAPRQVATGVTDCIAGGALLIIQPPGGGTAPSITTAPRAVVAVGGAPVEFSVVAGGSAPLTYQWYKDGVALVGACASRFVLPYARNADCGQYTVRVTNGTGAVTSPAAALALGAPPVVLPPLASYQLVGVGQPTSIVALASGDTPMSFEWLKDSDWLASTGSPFTLPVAAWSDEGVYAAIATNAACSDWGEGTALVVTGAQDAVGLDSFDDAAIGSEWSQPLSALLNFDGTSFVENFDRLLFVADHPTGPVSRILLRDGVLPLDRDWLVSVRVTVAIDAAFTGLAGPGLQRKTGFSLAVGNSADSDDSFDVGYRVRNSTGFTQREVFSDCDTDGVRESAARLMPLDGTMASVRLDYRAATGELVASVIDEGRLVPIRSINPRTQWGLSSAGTLRVALRGFSTRLDVFSGNVAVDHFLQVVRGAGYGSPVIVQQPQATTVAAGQSAILAVGASGLGTLHYRWYRGESGDVSRPLAAADSAFYQTGPLSAWGRYWVRVYSALGSVDSVSTLVTVTGGTMTFADWVAQGGVPPAQRGALATPAGDGVTNLMKFALGIAPLANATNRLPVATTVTQSGQPLALALLFQRNPEAQGLRCALETSSDLVTWTEVASTLEVLGTNPDGTQNVRLRETAPVAGVRRFGRLKVELVAP